MTERHDPSGPYDVHAGMAWHHQLTTALRDYAAAVAAHLAEAGVHGTYDLDAGADMAWIDLTVPALAGTVHEATLRFSDDLGWHYQPAVTGEPMWARLTPVTAATTAADLAPGPAEVAAAIAALTGGRGWPAVDLDALAAVDDLAGRWLGELLGVLETRCLVPA
jgi:hypothetical protein